MVTPTKVTANSQRSFEMEDRLVLRNMSIAIGVIALVAIGLITISTIIGSSF